MLCRLRLKILCSLFSVDIFCEVINGAFDVKANGGDGHKGQAGSPGSNARDSDNVVSIFSVVGIIEGTGENLRFNNLIHNWRRMQSVSTASKRGNVEIF